MAFGRSEERALSKAIRMINNSSLTSSRWIFGRAHHASAHYRQSIVRQSSKNRPTATFGSHDHGHGRNAISEFGWFLGLFSCHVPVLSPAGNQVKRIWLNQLNPETATKQPVSAKLARLDRLQILLNSFPTLKN